MAVNYYMIRYIYMFTDLKFHTHFVTVWIRRELQVKSAFYVLCEHVCWTCLLKCLWHALWSCHVRAFAVMIRVTRLGEFLHIG
jgi:hypothetical protein